METVISNSQNYKVIADTVREMTLSEDKYTPAQIYAGVGKVYDVARDAFGCKETISGVDSLKVGYVNPSEHIVSVKLSRKNLLKLEPGKSVGLNDGVITYGDPTYTRSAASQFIPIDSDTTYYLLGDGVAQLRVAFYDENLNFMGRTSQGTTNGYKLTVNNCTLNVTYTDINELKYIIVYVFASDYAPLAHNVQLELGTEATPYAPYIDDLSTLSLTAKKTATVNEYVGLPSEYQQVDYIESSKTQYIDTGIIPNQNTGIDIVVLSNDILTELSGKYGVFFGARSASRQHEFAASTYGSAGTVRFGTYSRIGYISVEKLIRIRIRNGIYTDNDGKTYDLSSGGEFESPCNLYLFALNQNGAIQHAAMQLYSCKVYDGDNLIRDFIPCYRIADGSIGLYELVGEQFYTNGGTGAFVKGEPVENVKHTYPVNEDGTVEGIKSIYPSMTLSSDIEGVVIEAEYFVDGQAKIQALTDTIVSLGGEL